MFGNVRLVFGTILENLRKVVGNLRKIIKNAVIVFDKGERLDSAVAFENFGAFIDTDLAPPKNSSGAKLFREK